MANWKVSKRRIPGPNRGAPVVHVTLPALVVKELHFATTAAGSEFKYIYLNSNTHALAPGDLKWWARGAKITSPEWVQGRPEASNSRACLTRKKTVAVRVKLTCSTTAALTGTLTASPTLDGSKAFLTSASTSFTYPAGAAEHWIVVTFGGQMPDEVGRYILSIAWSATGTGFSFGKQQSSLRIYSVYGQPFEPGYDSGVDADPGSPTSFADGTKTGTQKRLDHLVSLIGSNKRHPAATANDVIDLLWKLHVGINDTPGAPPYFDAGHTQYLTHNGAAERSGGTRLDLEDQWLAWVPTADPHWNDASCIGHVQILKTMAAAIGLFARRSWLFPSTPRMPDKTTRVLADTDLYCLGNYDASKLQTWTFVHLGVSYTASPKLMEPGQSWENYEACLRSPNGRFLPGGYPTSSCPASVRSAKGFGSAAELIRWWSSTSRAHFGQRFMAWVYHNEVTNEKHVWDVDGKHYDIADYVKIRTTHKQLPPP